MLAVLLIGLTVVYQLPVLATADSNGPIHNPSSFMSTYDPAMWKEMADAFRELDVTERTEFINAKQHFWKASEELRRELADVKLMGSPAASYDPSSYPSKNASEFDDSIEIPRHFDARDAWPQCRHLIDSVHNQRECGSCWAHATAGVMSDRLCIASNGTVQVPISVHQLVSCCHDCMPGTACTGGYPIAAYKYWSTDGLVTRHCLPLQKEMTYGDNPPCSQTCRYSDVSFEDHRYHGDSFYFLRGDGNATANAELIQREIMTNGPVTATITVTLDFPSYDEGVFMSVSPFVTGQHAIKIIGWGEEDKGLPYWIVVNSWGRVWGEDGYARIVRTINAMNIEGAVTAGTPKIQEPTVPVPEKMNETVAECNDGWSTIPGLKHNGKCYKVLNESMSWVEANTLCKLEGGNLASIANAYENAKLTDFLKTEGGEGNAFTIGLYGERVGGPYQWTDGTALQYVNWSRDVLTYGPGGRCGSLNAQGGSWSVGDCGSRLPAVCQMPV